MPEQPDINAAISEDALDSLMADMTEKDLDALQEEPSAAVEANPEDIQTEPQASSEQPVAQDDAAEEAQEPDVALSFATFPSDSAPSGNGVFRGFERVQDIPLDISVELGRTKLLIRDILDLETGAIIELEKMAGEPVDLLANGLLVARGEVVVIEDNFGVRITEIITQAERKEVTGWAEENRSAA